MRSSISWYSLQRIKIHAQSSGAEPVLAQSCCVPALTPGGFSESSVISLEINSVIFQGLLILGNFPIFLLAKTLWNTPLWYDSSFRSSQKQCPLATSWNKNSECNTKYLVAPQEFCSFHKKLLYSAFLPGLEGSKERGVLMDKLQSFSDCVSAYINKSIQQQVFIEHLLHFIRNWLLMNIKLLDECTHFLPSQRWSYA